MLRAAARRGYQLTSKARLVTVDDLETCDWVIAMDEENQEFLQKMTPQPRRPIRLMSEFLGDSRWPKSVPDPYYQDDQSFDFVLDMLEATGPGLLAQVLTTLAPSNGKAGTNSTGMGGAGCEA
jgi:protein-tyrosine phosphatase